MNSINRVNFFQMNNIEPMQLTGTVSIDTQNNTKSFKEVVGDLMSDINEVTNKPVQMTHALMEGKADIHDVMASIAQSELTVQAATTITGKILQTYEKIMQIQI